MELNPFKKDLSPGFDMVLLLKNEATHISGFGQRFDAKSNGEHTDAYDKSTRLSNMSVEMAMQSKDNGQLRGKIYFWHKASGKLPEWAGLGMSSGKHSGPLNCFMAKGQLLKKGDYRQRRQCEEKCEGTENLQSVGYSRTGKVLNL